MTLFFLFFPDSSLQGYIVVQKIPPIVIGPYSDLELAKNELRKFANNGKSSRMILEIINGVIQVDPHMINGVSETGPSQIPSNGFAYKWEDWDDINAMVEISKQHMGKNTYRPRQCTVQDSWKA